MPACPQPGGARSVPDGLAQEWHAPGQAPPQAPFARVPCASLADCTQADAVAGSLLQRLQPAPFSAEAAAQSLAALDAVAFAEPPASRAAPTAAAVTGAGRAATPSGAATDLARAHALLEAGATMSPERALALLPPQPAGTDAAPAA